jgi:hypothetical protein
MEESFDELADESRISAGELMRNKQCTARVWRFTSQARTFRKLWGARLLFAALRCKARLQKQLA